MSEQNIEKEQLYKGVFRAGKKDGTVYYRASLTKNGKHISLGSLPYRPIGPTNRGFSCCPILP